MGRHVMDSVERGGMSATGPFATLLQCTGWVIGFLVTLYVGVFYFEQTSLAKDALVQATVWQLARGEENERLWNAMYRGQQVEVTGRLADIELAQHTAGENYVTLTEGDLFWRKPGADDTAVICTFSDENLFEFERLYRRWRVTMVGTGDGYHPALGRIVLRDCHHVILWDQPALVTYHPKLPCGQLPVLARDCFSYPGPQR